MASLVTHHSSPTFDVVIVGAGIVGAACALECVRAGLKTAVVEASCIGGGATAEGMGHIVVLDDSEAQFALTRYSQDLWNEIAPELPRECEYNPCGTLWIASDDEEAAEVERKRDFFTRRGVAVEVLDSQNLAEAEPNLRKGLAAGLWVRGDGVMYPPFAAKHFIDQAAVSGLKLFPGKRVTDISADGVKLEDGRRLSAPVTVNACGVWSPTLAPGIDVKKRKGHLVITDRYPGFMRRHVSELGYLKSAHAVSSDSVAFSTHPRATGQILVGSSRQYGAEEKDISRSLLNRMLERACHFLPALRECSVIRVWTGFRAATPDKLPLIGPCPGREYLHLAAGHEGLGITTSLATAKLIADRLTGRQSVIPPEPYLPSRMVSEVAHG